MSEPKPDLSELIQRHQEYLARLVRRRAGRVVLEQESVVDLVQSIAGEIVRDRPEVHTEKEFRSWLRRVAISKLIDRHRHYTAQKRDVRREHEEIGAESVVGAELANTWTPSRFAMRNEQREQVRTVIQRLPPDYATILELFCFEELPHAEIAKRMGRDEAACRALLRRAKARLGVALERLKQRD